MKKFYTRKIKQTLIRCVNCKDFSPLALSIYLMISFNSAVVAGLANARCLIASNSPQILKTNQLKDGKRLNS
jgi:hypothetical protein